MPVDRRGRWTPATCPHPDLPPQAGKGGGAGLVRGDSPGRDGPAPRDDAVRSPRWAVPGLLQGRPDLGSLQGEVSTRGARKGNPLRACAALLGSFPACGALPGPPPMPVGRWGPSMHVEYAWGPLPCMWSTPGPPPPLAGEGRGGGTGAPTAGPRYSRSSRAQTPPPSTFTGNFATGS